MPFKVGMGTVGEINLAFLTSKTDMVVGEVHNGDSATDMR